MSPAGGFCRDCGADAGPAPRCTRCGSPRLLRHAELEALSVAHVDCDAFFATIEKRDDPSLRDKAVIIGGGKRGVVSTACYIARISGVRSAMPMFKALQLCPEAVVIKPNLSKYAAVGRQVRELMLQLTPMVEPVSIDEAFLDLSGTQLLHGMSPARSLGRFARTVETELGITVSIGLSYNKFLAKIASDLKKPRGFAVIGKAEARGFLADKPVSILPGVGGAAVARLAEAGIATVGDIAELPADELFRRLGSQGPRLGRLARGEDDRTVSPEREAKSISAETTFDEDIRDPERLIAILWTLSEKVSARLKAAELSGAHVTLKLKTGDFKTRTRGRVLPSPTKLAGRIFEAGRELLEKETGRDAFRLIGIGVDDLRPGDAADPPNLLEPDLPRQIAREAALDTLRQKFGRDSIARGLALKAERRPK